MEFAPDQKGGIAELAIASKANQLGIGVSRPMVEGLRYDLIFDWHLGLQRVQCKWATRTGDTVLIRCCTSRRAGHGHMRSTYSQEDVDVIAGYCAELEECWVVPIARVAGKPSLTLRLHPAKNNQRAGVTLAEPYRLGAIAQLGERSAGSRKVGGSSPPGSIDTEALAPAGASSFPART